MTAVHDELFAPPTPAAAPSEVLSWGLGADSTAILLRWLHEPASRDFDLDKLVVVTAHTGNEYTDTLRDAQDVTLPLASPGHGDTGAVRPHRGPNTSTWWRPAPPSLTSSGTNSKHPTHEPPVLCPPWSPKRTATRGGGGQQRKAPL